MSAAERLLSRLARHADELDGALAKVDRSVESSEGRAASTREWPESLKAHAFHGIAGEIVRALEPDTEADPAALLVQTLAAFGAMIGRGPHWRVEGVEHHTNLFLLLVGDTSKGRKGTSWGRVSSIFRRIPEPGMNGNQCTGRAREVSGLSSGEGVKWAVRDRITKNERNSKTDRTEEVVLDDGVADKRLLVHESEFAQVLRVCARSGNTLSATLRNAWDRGDLATLTKNDTVTATGAHIVVIGHVTDDELRAELTGTDAANGFANRFMFVCVRRSKKLPFGGEQTPETTLASFADRLDHAAQSARQLRDVTMTTTARDIWKAVYGELSDGRPGLLGAVTGRAEAQCIRLALLYALLDEARAIDAPHLYAALAVWDYAFASARYVFGDAVGDRVADSILSAVRNAGASGLTRTAIRDLFQKHQTAERIDAALKMLGGRKLIMSEVVDTGGRPAEIWRVS